MTGGSTTNYTYTSLDQLTGLNGTGGVTPLSYSYDGRGNLLTVKSGSSTVQSYIFNGADRLTQAVVGGTTSSYTYDANGRRVKSVVSGTTTNYLWDEASRYGDVVRETDGSGVEQFSYLLTGIQGELLSQNKASGTAAGRNYYLLDGLGSVRGLLPSSGATSTPIASEEYKYEAFGKLLSGQANPASRYLYTGQQFDTATGLYDLRARYYNLNQGRFQSQDKWIVNNKDPIELNRYSYIANNPVNYTDPSGNTFLDNALLKLYIKAAAFAEAHPIAATIIDLLVSLLLPMEIIGLPGPPIGGIRGAVDAMADVRMIPLFVGRGIDRNRLTGEAFNNFVRPFLRGAEPEVTFLANGLRYTKGAGSTLGTRRIDYLWRDTLVEVKSGRLDIGQLEGFLQAAQVNDYGLVYIVMRDGAAILQEILAVRQRTNTQNVPVRVISFE